VVEILRHNDEVESDIPIDFHIEWLIANPPPTSPELEKALFKIATSENWQHKTANTLLLKLQPFSEPAHIETKLTALALNSNERPAIRNNAIQLLGNLDIVDRERLQHTLTSVIQHNKANVIEETALQVLIKKNLNQRNPKLESELRKIIEKGHLRGGEWGNSTNLAIEVLSIHELTDINLTINALLHKARSTEHHYKSEIFHTLAKLRGKTDSPEKIDLAIKRLIYSADEFGATEV